MIPPTMTLRLPLEEKSANDSGNDIAFINIVYDLGICGDERAIEHHSRSENNLVVNFMIPHTVTYK